MKLENTVGRIISVKRSGYEDDPAFSGIIQVVEMMPRRDGDHESIIGHVKGMPVTEKEIRQEQVTFPVYGISTGIEIMFSFEHRYNVRN